MMRAENNSFRAVGLALVVFENTPGERCNWDTITRSVPLMMKEPFGRHQGTSPM